MMHIKFVSRKRVLGFDSFMLKTGLHVFVKVLNFVFIVK